MVIPLAYVTFVPNKYIFRLYEISVKKKLSHLKEQNSESFEYYCILSLESFFCETEDNFLRECWSPEFRFYLYDNLQPLFNRVSLEETIK